MHFKTWFVVLFSLLLSPSLGAIMVIPMGLTQMAQQSEKIFLGRCLNLSTELDENQMPATYIRFNVLSSYKGVEEGETVLIKQFGSRKSALDLREGEKVIIPMKSFSVAPQNYEEGKEYLLFLYPESSLGFTSPVGAGQGMFEVVPSGDGKKMVVNPFENRFLSEVRRQKGLSGPTGLVEMESAVEGLVLRGR